MVSFSSDKASSNKASISKEFWSIAYALEKNKMISLNDPIELSMIHILAYGIIATLVLAVICLLWKPKENENNE